jgi:hypothetical protein
MDFIIAIPSYNRPKELKEKTIATLQRYGISKDKVYIFVANEEEKTRYAEIDYGTIVVGVLGLTQQRMFIYNYFPTNTNIVSCDDDIEEFFGLDSNKKLVNLSSFSSLINTIQCGFDECRAKKYHLWGIAPVANAFFMRHSHTDTPNFCIGHFFGYINDKQFTYQVSAPKDDYELSAFYSKQDGGVIRFMYVAAKTKMGANGGIGMNKKNRLEANKKATEELLTLYPDYFRRHKKEGEVLFKKPSIIKKVLPPSERHTNAVKNILTEEDKQDMSITTLPIKNNELYEEAKTNLLKALSQMTVPPIAPGQSKGKMTARRERGDVIGTDGRSISMGFGDNRSGWNYFRNNSKYPDVYKALIEFGNHVVPKGWDYQLITLNHNCKAKKHIDGKNVGKSIIIGIGEYEGGFLRVYSKDSSSWADYDVKNKPTMFNGGVLPHETQSFSGEGTSGKYVKGKGRYTLIFYKGKRSPADGSSVGLGV